MKTQNITLSIPKDILLRIKLIAAKRQTSVSGLLTQTLEKVVKQEDEYGRAWPRNLKRLEQEFDLGTNGRSLTKRDELHD
jgi:hypothetical protein